jgi:Bacterial Ig-like domain (group 3)/MBG domain (YGX type)
MPLECRSQDGNANYNAAPNVDQAFTVAPVALTITANAKTRLYGDANPAFDATYSGFVLNEGPGNLTGALSCTTTATASSAVGTYPITCSGQSATNYVISYVNGTLTVTSALLTVTADNASRLYGEPNPPFTASYSGFKNGETLATSGVTGSPSLTTTATATGPVGPYPITAAVGTLASGNYDFTVVNGTLAITKAHLTVRASDKSREYGDPNPTLTASYSGFKLSDTFASAATGTPDLSTTATQSSSVGSYPITAALGSLTATNYDFTFVNGTLIILKAHLTVTANDKSRVYSDSNPTFTASYSGFKNSDTFATAVAGSPSLTTTATATSPVGPYTITAAQGILAATNYGFGFVNGTLTITKATLTVIPADKSKTYGDTFTALTGTIVGIQNSDAFTATYASAGAAATAGVVGSPYDITVDTVTATSGSLDNYTVVKGNGKLTVTPATPTTNVTSDANPSVFGQSVTFTATVSSAAGTPTGSVQFKDNSSPIGGPVDLSGGTASLSIGTLSAGSHSITAEYKGDTNFKASTGSVSQLVQYKFIGFLSPVENVPVFNVGKAGRTVPVKWQLTNALGEYLSSLSVVQPNPPLYQQITCDTSAPSDALPADINGSSGLRYDTTANQYIFTWQTSSTFANKCYQLLLQLDDGTLHTARFKFTK